MIILSFVVSKISPSHRDFLRLYHNHAISGLGSMRFAIRNFA
nr:MAG TPA: hypothetical protein [Caudoviricetes sp.]